MGLAEDRYGDPPDDLAITLKKRDAAVVACAMNLVALVDGGLIVPAPLSVAPGGPLDHRASCDAVIALRRQTHYLGVLIKAAGPEAKPCENSG